MWLLSQARKNTEYLRNMFFPEAFLFMEEEMLTLHKTPCNNNITASELHQSVIMIKVFRIWYSAVVRYHLYIVLEKHYPEIREKEPEWQNFEAFSFKGMVKNTKHAIFFVCFLNV